VAWFGLVPSSDYYPGIIPLKFDNAQPLNRAYKNFGGASPLGEARMPFDRSEAWRALGLAILGIALIFLAGAALSRPSEFYSTSSPETQAWFKDQHNAKGEWCCSEADGEAYYGGISFNADGSVALDGGVVIPAYMVLHGPNPVGHAILWHSGSTNYCFSPGAMN
jgi:hypothetical protein